MNTQQKLSERQKVTLTVIKNFHALKGFPPSVRDISDQMGGISPNAVQQHLNALARKGAIKREPRVARSITIL